MRPALEGLGAIIVAPDSLGGGWETAAKARGIKLTAPYRRAPELNNAGVAVITDPWGTVIELTEGLRQVF